MSSSAFVVFLVVLCAGSSFAQNNAPCHADIFTLTPRHSLDIPAFLGNWYEHEFASSDIGNTPPADYRCRSINLSMPNATNPLRLTAGETYVDLATDQIRTGLGYISINDTRSPLSSVWQMEDATSGLQSPMVLLAADLDFAQWAVIYQCQHIGPENYRWETVTAYGRTRGLDAEVRRFLKALMVGVGFRIGDHHSVRQDTC